MKKCIVLLIIALCSNLAFGQKITDPARIDVYITPFYNSKGPSIDIGPFSKGLGAKNEDEFLSTIAKMKQSWSKLTFAEAYVAAIQLYDRGYRMEAVYWFYSAQYRARLFGALHDEGKPGAIGDPGFELNQAAQAFYQLVGPYINGYVGGYVDEWIKVIEKVQKEGLTIPDLGAIYPGIKFKEKSEWKNANEHLNEGLTKMVAILKAHRDEIEQQRKGSRAEAGFARLTNKDLPAGSNEQPSTNGPNHRLP